MFSCATATSTPLAALQPATSSTEEPYLLEVINVSKGFPGVVALDDVQLRVRPARYWR